MPSQACLSWERTIANQTADNRFNVKRIAAKDSTFDPFMKQGLHGLFLPLQGGLANAGKAGVRAQTDEQIVAQARVCQEGLEVVDFHDTGLGFPLEI